LLPVALSPDVEQAESGRSTASSAADTAAVRAAVRRVRRGDMRQAPAVNFFCVFTGTRSAAGSEYSTDVIRSSV